jgi:hypothetical protein
MFGDSARIIAMDDVDLNYSATRIPHYNEACILLRDELSKHYQAYRLPIRQSVILIGPNNEGKSNILRALVTSLEVLSNLGRVRIMRGRLRGPLLTGTIYDWATDYPISLQETKPDGE